MREAKGLASSHGRASNSRHQREMSRWQRLRLLRRSLDEGAKSAEMAYVLVFAPTGTSLEEMVEAFGTRLPGRAVFEEAEGEVGLDKYEVRTFHGWYRHYSEYTLDRSVVVKGMSVIFGIMAVIRE